MDLKLSQTKSILLITFQVMNHLLQRGFIFFCIWHPVVTIITLNAISAMALHEACHLGFSRKLCNTTQGTIVQRKGSLSAYVILSKSKWSNVVICFSPIALGIAGISLHYFSSLNIFITIPWIMNLTSLLPFSQDMKTFSHSLNIP